MKKYFWLFMVVASNLQLFGQQQAPNFTLDKQLYGQQEYQASQYIDMIDHFGYKANTKNDVFHAKIDPFIVFPPEEGEIGGPNPGDRGVVGSIAGVFDVNELGAGSYTIPINLPQGIGNNVPQVSLNYNSMAGNGIMGIGWNIGGTSAITRTGKTIYHDSYIEGIKFDATDNFLFNGNRMLPINENTYTTEVEVFTRISTMVKNVYGPVWFEARTKDGKILRYGQTQDSRQKLQGTENIIAWYLSSVEDLSGNLIVYNYELKQGNLLLKRINYGGNTKTGQGHIYEIGFNYKNGRIDPYTTYFSGATIITNCLLENIFLQYMPTGQKIFTYTLEYDNTTNIFTRLNKVEIKDEKMQLGYNPTDIGWGDATENFSFEPTNIHKKPGFGAENTLGDFNGDGKTDILCAYYSYINGVKAYDSWAIYYLNPIGTSYNKVEMGLLDEEYQPKFVYFESGDFNGDGIDDLFKVTLFAGSYQGHIYISDGNNEFTYSATIPTQLLKNHYINITDINGNGINEILLVKKLDDDKTWFNCYELNPTTNILQELFTDPSATTGYYFHHDKTELFQIKSGDFNGDGRTDLLVNTNSLESTIFCLHPTEPRLVELTPMRLGYPNRYHRVYTGDFNGDGITDILTFAYASQQYNWELSNFDGKGEWKSAICPLTGNIDPGNPDHPARYIYTTDINGDGKSDILDVHFKSSNGLILGSYFDMYYSKGDGFKTEKQYFSSLVPHISHIHNFFDFNGDGKGESFIWTSPDEPMHIMSYHKNEKSNLAISFANGLGNKTSVNYLPITDALVYFKDSKVQFPLCNLQSPAYIVRSRMDDIGDSHKITQSYRYGNLLIHKQGKGLLGFKNRSVYDNQTEMNSIIKNDVYTFQGKFYFLYQKQTEVYNQRGQVIAETTNTFSHKGYSSSPLRFFPYIANSHSFEKELSTNDFVRTTHSIFSYDDYGNLLTKKTLVDPAQKNASCPASEYTHETNTTIIYKDPDLTNWFIGLPEKITSKVRYLSEEKDEATTLFTYYEPNKPEYPLLKEKKVYPGNNTTSKLGTNESYSYDVYGNMKSATINAPYSHPPLEARSSSSIYSPDYKYRFATSTTNAMGQVSTATYDPMYGTMKTLTDPNGLTTHYDSSPLGTFSKTTSPDGITTTTVTRWAKDHKHAPLNALYYNWQQTSGSPEGMVFYHKTGVELRSVTFGFDGSALYVDKIYDNKGLVHKESLPYKKGENPIYTEYLYDDYNRLETVISPDNTTSTTTYSANKVSVTTTSENNEITRTSSKKYNAAGWLIESTDNKNNIVKNEYYCNGSLRKSYIMGQASTAITLEYDDRGNRTLLTDPNYGRMASLYNAFGEIEEQTNPHNELIRFSYNKLSQTTSETSIEGTIDWLYSAAPGRIGTLESINKSNHQTNYSYDNYLRPISVTEIIAGESYTTHFTYNELGWPETTTHPTGITIREGYNQWGYHTTVKIDIAGQQLWKTEDVSPLGMVTRFKTGNGLVTEQTFHPLSMRIQTVKTLKTGSAPVQDLEYAWYALGNLQYRKKGALTESFTYDDLDRLKTIILNGMTMGNHEYDDSDLGNIIQKQTDGQNVFNNAIYGGSNGSVIYGPHAISSVSTSNLLLTGPHQIIRYNGFDKVKQISEGNNTLDIQYGSYNQRISQQYTTGTNTVEKLWAGACEFITKNGQLYKHTYLSGPMGVFAIHIINPDGSEVLRYIHKDHLGSWNTITDEQGNLLEELSFDAWGNRRNPTTWRAFTGTPSTPLFDRGYTGHEHLYAFNLINMNGRFYDPIVGSMLSPDNYMQAPGYSQNFNRYSYCLNNPLVYTDPSGEIVWFVPLIYAAVNIGFDLIANDFKMNIGEIAMSAASGAIGGLIGGTNITSVASAFLSATASQMNRFLPNISIYQSENFSLGISPMVGFGSHGFNFGANLNASGQSGDFAYSASIGVGFNSGMNSLGESAGSSGFWNGGGFGGCNDGHSNYGLGYSYNSFGGKTGQGVGAATLQIGDFAFRFDEDWSPLGDGEDRFRTGGALFTFKLSNSLTLAFGGSMITGDAGGTALPEGNPTINPETQKPAGTWDPSQEYMTKLRGGTMYGGVIYNGQSYFAGNNSEKRLHQIQNFIHKNVGTPYFYDHQLSSRSYGYYGGFHSNYLFY